MIPFLLFLLALILGIQNPAELQTAFASCADRGYSGTRCTVYVIATLAQGATQESADAAADAPIREQRMVYDTSLAGYYAIGTNVVFTGTQEELWGDAAGSYAGRVIGYQLTSFANQPLSTGYTVAYIIQYNTSRIAVIPPERVSG